MSRLLEELLKNDLRVLLKVYVGTFPYSYAIHRGGPADFMADLKVYEDTIAVNRDEICRAAAWGISGYSALYRVLPMAGFDEFKTIYFLGRAVEKRLLAANQVKMAQIHMFTMIGLLDEKLRSKGVDKESLRVAMTDLVRLSRFDQELGATGCYLIYKCSSTTSKHWQPPQAA